MEENVSGSENVSFPINTNEISFALEMTRFVSDRILIPVIVCLGIAGNTCNIAVLSRPKMRTSTNVYLTNLAIFDTLYLIFMLTLSLIHCRDMGLDASNYYYIPYGRVLSDLFGNCSVWVTVGFTLERYIGVCYPMKGKAWCTVQKAKLLTFIVFLFCLVNTLPEAFEYEVSLEPNVDVIHSNTVIKSYLMNRHNDSKVKTGDNLTKTDQIHDVNRFNSTSKSYKCGTSDFAESQSYQFGYYWWYIAIFTFLPVILLSVFNMLLIKSVWHAHKRRKFLLQSHVLGEHSSQSVEQQKVTTMLISVVLIFLLCQFPWAILLLYKVYLSALNIPHAKDLILIAGNVCNLLGQLNASINFILYSYFSSRFRRTFKNLVCRLHTKRKPTNILISDYMTRKSEVSKDSITNALMPYRYRRSTGRETNPIWKAPHVMIS